MQLSLTPQQICALVVATVGVIIDWRTNPHIIPNWLTFPAAAVGIGLNFMTNGVDGALSAVAGWFVGALVMLVATFQPLAPKYDKDRMGMGDTKLMAAIGAFLGPGTVLVVFFYFCLSYGLIALFRLMRAVPWKQLSYLVAMTVTKSKGAPPPFDISKLLETGKSFTPIGLAITMGTVLTVLLERPTLKFLGFS